MHFSQALGNGRATPQHTADLCDRPNSYPGWMIGDTPTPAFSRTRPAISVRMCDEYNYTRLTRGGMENSVQVGTGDIPVILPCQ